MWWKKPKKKKNCKIKTFRKVSEIPFPCLFRKGRFFHLWIKCFDVGMFVQVSKFNVFRWVSSKHDLTLPYNEYDEICCFLMLLPNNFKNIAQRFNLRAPEFIKNFILTILCFNFNKFYLNKLYLLCILARSHHYGIMLILKLISHYYISIFNSYILSGMYMFTPRYAHIHIKHPLSNNWSFVGKLPMA